MFSLSKNRWLVVSMGHFIALFLITQLNYYLAIVSMNVIITGMLISYSALMLSYSQGLFSLIPIAFYLDSKSPLPFGSTLAITVALHSLVVGFRNRLRRESIPLGIFVSQSVNLLIFLGYSFFIASSPFGHTVNYFHTALNLILSSIVVAIVNQSFFVLQTEALSFFGIRLAEEQRESR